MSDNQPSTVSTSPDPDAAARAQRVQNVRNLSVLARQAIARGDAAMQVKPQLVADLCLEYEAMSRAPIAKSDQATIRREMDQLTASLTRTEQSVDEHSGRHAVSRVQPPPTGLHALIDEMQDTLNRMGMLANAQGGAPDGPVACDQETLTQGE